MFKFFQVNVLIYQTTTRLRGKCNEWSILHHGGRGPIVRKLNNAHSSGNGVDMTNILINWRITLCYVNIHFTNKKWFTSTFLNYGSY